MKFRHGEESCGSEYGRALKGQWERYLKRNLRGDVEDKNVLTSGPYNSGVLKKIKRHVDFGKERVGPVLSDGKVPEYP
uniref:Uncharacterized protein n=1 Tax=Cucumis sativus TaxID=3659 RepID=A0A0A0LLW9_CUCSA